MKNGKTIAAVAFVVVSALLTATSASAHARYKDSTPARGAVVAAAPSSLTITYSNDIQRISGTYDVAVADANGADVTNGPSAIDNADRSMVSVPLRLALPPGRYVVRWENISDEDGDPAQGAFSFYVGQQPTASDLAADAELAAVGAEADTPEASPTSAVTATPSLPAASPTPAPVSSGGDDGDSGSRIWIIGASIVIAVTVTGFIVWRTIAKKDG